jgi:hypothetical protein
MSTDAQDHAQACERENDVLAAVVDIVELGPGAPELDVVVERIERAKFEIGVEPNR